MPLYEYHCARCDSTVEVLQRRSDEQPECPQCQGHELEKLMSVPAAPSVRGGASGSQLPMASGPGCGAPRCCGGGCAM